MRHRRGDRRHAARPTRKGKPGRVVAAAVLWIVAGTLVTLCFPAFGSESLDGVGGWIGRMVIGGWFVVAGIRTLTGHARGTKVTGWVSLVAGLLSLAGGVWLLVYATVFFDNTRLLGLLEEAVLIVTAVVPLTVGAALVVAGVFAVGGR